MNPRHEEAVYRLTAPHREKFRDGTVDDALRDRIAQEAVAEGILTGWEGIDAEDDSGPLPFSVETAKSILTDPRNEDAYRFIVIEAQKDSAYLARTASETAKNSKPS